MADSVLSAQRRTTAAGRLWGIVPAGGRASRAWRFFLPSGPPPGPGSLTSILDRAGSLIGAGRLVAVLARGHEHGVDARADVRRVVQPAYRGSAAEVFLPLLAIMRHDPGAIVVVLPPGAVGQDEPEFLPTIEAAAEAVAVLPELPVVIGLPPPCPRPCGWLEAGEPIEGLEAFGVRAVRRFVRRPSAAEITAFHAAGGLAGTGVVVAEAATLLALGRRHLPDVLETLEPLEAALGAPEERLLCEAVYEAMPYADLSHALFTADERLGVLAIPRTRTRVRPVASA
jgi:mannose-1-phosphate guanylyltransferase